LVIWISPSDFEDMSLARLRNRLLPAEKRVTSSEHVSPPDSRTASLKDSFFQACA